MFAVFLWSLVAFIASAIAMWFAIVLGVVAYWGFAGIRDRDGGGTMALGFFIAPAIALPVAIVVAVIVFTKLANRRRETGTATPAQGRRDRRYFAIFGSAIAGWIAGLYVTRFAWNIFGPERYDSYFKVLLNAWLPDVAGIACAFAAGFAANRSMRPSAGDPPPTP